MTFRTARRCAGVVALVAIAMAIFLAVRGSARPNAFLNQSWATFFASVAAVIVAAGASRVALLSDASEPRFQQWLDAWRRLAPLQGNRAVCFVVALFAFGLHGELADRQRPSKDVQYIDDEADYLRVAKEMRDLPGGVYGLLPSLYRGEFAEDNRHPLYPALLAAGGQIKLGERPLLLIPTELSKAFGLFVVLATTVIGWKLFGPAVGALSSVVVAVNGAMIQSSSLIACETLLVLLTTLAWYGAALMLWRLPESDGISVTLESSSRSPNALAFVVGLLFGLAYLTKASAAFPFFILLALLVVMGVGRGSKRPWSFATVMLLAFIVVASPLLVRNTIRYHNPLHSFNNKLLFAESYESGIAEPHLGVVGDFQRYLGRHSAKEVIVDRFFGGIAWEGFVLFRTVGPWPFDSGRAVLGAIVIGFACIGLGTASGRRIAPAFVLLWTAWFLLFFGWYQPIASGDRFLLPFVPPLSIASSLGFLALLRALLSMRKN